MKRHLGIPIHASSFWMYYFLQPRMASTFPEMLRERTARPKSAHTLRGICTEGQAGPGCTYSTPLHNSLYLLRGPMNVQCLPQRA